MPMLNHPFSDHPDVQHEHTLVQFEVMPSCSVTVCLGKEAHPHLVTHSLLAVVESDKVTQEPPFPQTKWFPHLLLILITLSTFLPTPFPVS